MASGSIHVKVTREEAWETLKRELSPAMRADDSQYYPVTAEDVIRRNQSR